MENDHSYLNDPQRAHDTRWVQRAAFHDASSNAREVFAALAELTARRERQGALAAGASRRLLLRGSPLLALLRDERFLSLSNFSDAQLRVSLAAIGAGSWPGQDDTVELAPWGMLWLERP